MSNNIQNLIPMNKRSKKEARENGKLGGIISGKVRKEKKELKEQLDMVINILTSKELNKQNLSETEKYILQNSNILVYELVKTALKGKSNTIRLKAIQEILNRLYGMPNQKIEQKNSMGFDFSNLSDEELESRIEKLSQKIQ